MLTAIPTTLLHRVRDAAAYVVVLAEFGLEVLCHCGEDHRGGLHRIGAS